MIINMICLIAVFLSAYVLLVEAAGGIVWAPDGGESRCEMRFEDMPNMRACDQWPGPSIRGDTGFMRVFRIVTAIQKNTTDLRGQTYTCPNLQSFYRSSGRTQPQNCPDFDCYKNLVAERIVYGTLYLAAPNNQLFTKGKFGPLFVRTPNNETWANVVPGFDHSDDDYAHFNFFVPFLRRSFSDPNRDNYDDTLKEWSASEPGKRDFMAGATLSVICRDAEKNCEPPIWGTSTNYLISYTPLARGTSYDMNPQINVAWIDTNTFHLDLKHWIPSGAADTGLSYYATQVYNGGISSYGASHACKHPQVQFVLYDSNPTPHNDACDTDPSRWNRKNGEVRAVFAKFSKNMEIGYQTTVINSYTVQTTYLVKNWDITLDSSNWKEEQLRFLAEWQKESPAGLDGKDTSWYKNWKKATGMSVAFTFCACKDSGFDNPNYSCIDYLHKQVEIRGRNWLA